MVEGRPHRYGCAQMSFLRLIWLDKSPWGVGMIMDFVGRGHMELWNRTSFGEASLLRIHCGRAAGG